jgi:hypothetical protein
MPLDKTAKCPLSETPVADAFFCIFKSNTTRRTTPVRRSFYSKPTHRSFAHAWAADYKNACTAPRLLSLSVSSCYTRRTRSSLPYSQKYKVAYLFIRFIISLALDVSCDCLFLPLFFFPFEPEILEPRTLLRVTVPSCVRVSSSAWSNSRFLVSRAGLWSLGIFRVPFSRSISLTVILPDSLSLQRLGSMDVPVQIRTDALGCQAAESARRDVRLPRFCNATA